MKMTNKCSMRRWELALLLGVAAALVVGTWLSGARTALAEKVVRLHVIGASDSAEDQELKLRVRDAVLNQARPWLEGVSDRGEAEAVLTAHLGELALAGAEAAGGAAVTVQLEEDAWFPTKVYEDFSLPAGRYPALKVILGEGEGRNWWCVVYPMLCAGPVSELDVKTAGYFSDGQVRLITEEGAGYAVKFKLLELWDRLLELWG